MRLFIGTWLRCAVGIIGILPHRRWICDCTSSVTWRRHGAHLARAWTFSSSRLYRRFVTRGNRVFRLPVVSEHLFSPRGTATLGFFHRILPIHPGTATLGLSRVWERVSKGDSDTNVGFDFPLHEWLTSPILTVWLRNLFHPRDSSSRSVPRGRARGG